MYYLYWRRNIIKVLKLSFILMLSIILVGCQSNDINYFGEVSSDSGINYNLHANTQNYLLNDYDVKSVNATNYNRNLVDDYNTNYVSVGGYKSSDFIKEVVSNITNSSNLSSEEKITEADSSVKYDSDWITDDLLKASSKRQQIVKYALQFVGNKYVYGGNSLTNGTDCSGFVHYVFKHFDIKTARTSYSIRKDGKSVTTNKIQPGDIVCYQGHVAIYIGDGKIVHASNSNPYPRGGIKVSDNYKYRRIVSIRNVID